MLGDPILHPQAMQRRRRSRSELARLGRGWRRVRKMAPSPMVLPGPTAVPQRGAGIEGRVWLVLPLTVNCSTCGDVRGDHLIEARYLGCAWARGAGISGSIVMERPVMGDALHFRPFAVSERVSLRAGARCKLKGWRLDIPALPVGRAVGEGCRRLSVIGLNSTGLCVRSVWTGSGDMSSMQSCCLAQLGSPNSGDVPAGNRPPALEVWGTSQIMSTWWTSPGWLGGPP